MYVERARLTHTLDVETGHTLCKRIAEEGLADLFATDEFAPPTCPKCLRRDQRFDRVPKGQEEN